MDDYRPTKLPVRLCLFKAMDNLAWQAHLSPNDLGWAGLCADLSLWPVPGDHLSLNAPENIAATRASIFAALEGSGKSAALVA
jgi:thioesterase domain-containing protein